MDAAFTGQIGDLEVPAEIRTADPPITDSLRLGPGWTWGHGLLLNTHGRAGRSRARPLGWPVSTTARCTPGSAG